MVRIETPETTTHSGRDDKPARSQTPPVQSKPTAQSSVNDLTAMFQGLQVNLQRQLDHALEQRFREFQTGSSVGQVQFETNFGYAQRDNQYG